jgi:hypothetical protein
MKIMWLSLLVTTVNILIHGQISIAFNKPKICTLTMNSTNEKVLFQKYYKPEFDFIELTQAYGPGGRTASINDERWFHKACSDENLICDIVLISGHFGGEFAGDGDGPTLRLSTIKDRAVKGNCKPILEKSKEVYLFGCNTLAEKNLHNRDSRFTTYGQYYNHLLHERYEEADAKFITDAKFLPTGFTIREQMQMIFTGPKIIYGFNDVAPTGAAISERLKKFLELRKSEGGLTVQSLNEQSEQIKNRDPHGAYWGNKFTDIITNKSHADFGLAFSDNDQDGHNFIAARDLNWSFHLIPFKPRLSSDENWAPLFTNIKEEMRSSFPLEMAPEVLYFFNSQLQPFLNKNHKTPFIVSQLKEIQTDPLNQEFIKQMESLLDVTKTSGNLYPQLSKSIQITLQYLKPDEQKVILH